MKGCSTEHFLLHTWDKILTSLDNGTSAANLVSIDFAKAFNRMDHSKCLGALSRLGASEEVIGWTSAFVCLFVYKGAPLRGEGAGGVLFMRSQFPTPRAR